MAGSDITDIWAASDMIDWLVTITLVCLLLIGIKPSIPGSADTGSIDLDINIDVDSDGVAALLDRGILKSAAMQSAIIIIKAADVADRTRLIIHIRYSDTNQVHLEAGL